VVLNLCCEVMNVFCLILKTNFDSLYETFTLYGSYGFEPERL